MEMNLIDNNLTTQPRVGRSAQHCHPVGWEKTGAYLEYYNVLGFSSIELMNIDMINTGECQRLVQRGILKTADFLFDINALEIY